MLTHPPRCLEKRIGTFEPRAMVTTSSKLETNACVGDSFLKGQIRRDGRKHECNFCGEIRKAWPLGELAKRVRGLVEEHFRIYAE
jgi:hypothetical protein